MNELGDKEHPYLRPIEEWYVFEGVPLIRIAMRGIQYNHESNQSKYPESLTDEDR